MLLQVGEGCRPRPTRAGSSLFAAAVVAVLTALVAAPLIQGAEARPATDAADRVIFWAGCDEVASLTDVELDDWKGRGVDGFVCMAGRLRGLGGSQDFDSDPNADLASPSYELQRALRDSRIVERAATQGMKLYLGVKLANYYNTATPLAEWFDDAGWSQQVLPKVRDLAAAAKTLGFAGIALDQELYPQRGGVSTATWAWDYPGNSHAEEEVRAQARQRGAEVMRAIVEGFPGVELAVHQALFPGDWRELIQEELYGTTNTSSDRLDVDFWDGMTSVEGYDAIRFYDSVFYKSPHRGDWENALTYNMNRVFATFSNEFSNWDYASSRVYLSPFSWIDEGPKPTAFDDPRSPEYVREQLLAFRKWAMGGEFANFAFGPLREFDYSPYEDAIQAGSSPGGVDGVAPTVGASGSAGGFVPRARIEGTAHDNLAIRVVRWEDDRGGSGVARHAWRVVDGDYESGYEWQTQWSVDGGDITPGATEVTITAEDIKGHKSAAVVLPWTNAPDTASPETAITKKPRRRTTRRTVSFLYRSSESGSAFECRLDRRAWISCPPSGKTYRLPRRRHTFRVRAGDPAGNVDATAAGYRFKIVDR